MKADALAPWAYPARTMSLAVAGLWLRLFPALAQSSALVQAGTAEP
jgi:hypothetical protein